MRLDELRRLASRRRLDMILACTPPSVRAFAGIACDNAVLRVVRAPTASARPSRARVALYTDFRYVPMVHRVAPTLACRDLRRLKVEGRRIGFESSIAYAQYLRLKRLAGRGAAFVDVAKDLAAIRAVKTPEEIAGLRAAERLTCEIWAAARARFEAGMTERQMVRIVRTLMVARGDGEAFDTIVCVGKNAAECHHEPDDTVWDGREPVLVDMGVRLDGFCSDLTRNLVPGLLDASGTAGRHGPSPLYRQVYGLVREANRAAIAAARPGLTGRQLDKVARDVIARGGFGRFFGHSLGHGVGYEIHEAPYASRRSDTVLKPGMVVTIEPGVYLEGRLGVRIEDLVLITENGCEVLSLADGEEN